MKQHPDKSKSKFPRRVTNSRHFLIFLITLAFAGFCHGQIPALPDIGQWDSRSPAIYAAQIARATPEESARFERESLMWLRQNLVSGGVNRREWNDVYHLYRWARLKQLAPSGQIAPEDWEALINRPALASTFLDELTPFDHPGNATIILATLLKTDTKAFDDFPALASAFALVWDEPRQKPYHHQVPENAIPQDDLTVEERFMIFVEASRKNQLKNDLGKLRADELVFVVDSRLPRAQWDWIRKEVRVNKSALGDVYFSIRYDDQRLNSGIFDWPHPQYRMEDIRQMGGICVDQAYYAVEVARAYGIPALYFEGTGRRGGHAWFGYLKGATGWDMDVGRFTYDKFATGYTIHPQTRQRISDHELQLIGRSIRRQAPYLLSERQVAVAELFLQEPVDAGQALIWLDRAISTDRRNHVAWLVKSAILEHAGGKNADYEKHLRDMSAQFATQGDLNAQTQMRLIGFLEENGRDEEAQHLRKSLIRKKAGDRHDVSLKLISDQLTAKIKRKETQGAIRDFEKAVMKFKKESGAVLELMFSFVSDCLEAGDHEAGRKALDIVEKNIQFDILTRKHFYDFKAQVDGFIAKKGE